MKDGHMKKSIDASVERKTKDLVNHPAHYAEDGQFSFPKAECIMLTRLLDFSVGNAVKYIWRAGFKGSAAEDLRKALWYINDAIKTNRIRDSRTAAVCIARTLAMMLRPAPGNALAERKLTAIRFLCSGFPENAKVIVEQMINEEEKA